MPRARGWTVNLIGNETETGGALGTLSKSALAPFLTTARALVLVAFLSLGLLALSPSQTATAQDGSADPASVLLAFANAYNSGDEDVAGSLFTDSAVWVRAAPTGGCARQTPCVGLDEISSRLQDGVATNNCYTILDTTVSGNVVTAHAESRNDDLRARGIERVRNVWMAWVPQGKLAALYIVNDTADPLTAANDAIRAGTQGPGTPIPSPSTPCGSD